MAKLSIRSNEAATVSSLLTEGSGLGASNQPPVTHVNQGSSAYTGPPARQPLQYALVGDSMLLHLREGEVLGERMKQDLMDMLEFAEEELQCQRVLLGVSRQRQDKDTLLKTLLFLGFASFNPREERLDVDADGYVYMAYQIAE